jgi:hypothetical protein
MRGGARAGAGRPKKPDRTQRHTIMMTPKEWETYQAEGGTKTLRQMINLGQFKKGN